MLFLPNSFVDCFDCPYLQYQTSENTGTKLIETYLCRYLRSMGISYFLEIKRVGENLGREQYTPHEKCPMLPDQFTANLLGGDDAKTDSS